MTAVRYEFPREEANFFCRLSMRKYSKPRPNSPLTADVQASIRLPLPTNLTDSFNIATNDEKFDLIGNFGTASEVYAAGAAKAEQYAREFKTGGSTLDLIKKIGIEAAAVAPGISDTKLGAAAQSAAGFIRNPHLTTVFEGVRLKTYSFNWKLSPRSQQEAQDLERIVNYIKAYMHPQILGAGFALEYPYLATLDFVVGESSNMLPNVRPSFITRLDVNSMSSGVPAFFKDGRPVTVEMTIGFQEINIQTREDFLRGNNSTRPTTGGVTNPNTNVG